MTQIARIAGLTLLTATLTATLGIPSANADSGSYVKTPSGQMRCLVKEDSVVCEHGPDFPQAPGFDGAVIDTSGDFHWANGNIGAGTNAIVLNDGQTYRLHGWAIVPSSDGTRFTNDRTGHGMFVSVENVYAF
jgi:hypothetical protein